MNNNLMYAFYNKRFEKITGRYVVWSNSKTGVKVRCTSVVENKESLGPDAGVFVGMVDTLVHFERGFLMECSI